jgi:hypothetical protein
MPVGVFVLQRRRVMFGNQRARAVVIGIAAAVIGLLPAAVATASSRGHAHPSPVVSPHLRRVGKAGLIWAGSRYVVAATGTAVTLIDDQTGQVRTVSRVGCGALGPSALEPPDLPWVPFNCAPGVILGGAGIGPPAPELYSPASGQWQAVSPSPGVVCPDAGCTDQYFPEGAGSAWLQYDHESCDTGGQHCSSSSVFQNLSTGELRQDPSGGATTVDLNAPNLSRTVCRPLTVPTTFELYAPGPVPGSLTFHGSFALAIGGGGENGPRVYLERCGTHLHRLLTTAPLEQSVVVGANTHEVIWMSHPHFLSALTLPGLRPFTIRLPRRLIARTCSPDDYSACVAQIALTSRRLYLLTASYPAQLWTAPNPLPAKPRRQ